MEKNKNFINSLNWNEQEINVPFKGYPGEEAVLEMVMFDLKDLVSSLKLLIYDDEYLLELLFSLLILSFTAHSVKLKSESSCFLAL